MTCDRGSCCPGADSNWAGCVEAGPQLSRAGPPAAGTSVLLEPEHRSVFVENSPHKKAHCLCWWCERRVLAFRFFHKMKFSVIHKPGESQGSCSPSTVLLHLLPRPRSRPGPEAVRTGDRAGPQREYHRHLLLGSSTCASVLK